jgi:hypothetical protein
MSVLNMVPLSGRKTISVEAPRINDLDEVGILPAPLETSRVTRRRLGRSEYFVRGATGSALHQRSCVGYAQRPVGEFLMTRLGPVCITSPRAAVHNTSGYLGIITTRRETKELTEKSHRGIV